MLALAFREQIGPKWGFSSTLRQEDDGLSSSLIIPFCVAAVSSFVLFLQAVAVAWSRSRRTSRQADKSTTSSPQLSFISSHGGSVIFAFKTLRLTGCLVVLLLSLPPLFDTEQGGQYVIHPGTLLNLTIASTYCYSSIMAAGAIIGGKWGRIMSYHNDLVLLSSFAVFAYRDLWPFATYTENPADGSEGSILWVKIAILALISVGVFLFIPRQYVPVDPENPAETPNPEQTASIFSRLVYSYMDPIVFEAYQVSHLSHTRIPPLADYFCSKYLIEYSFPHLDVLRGTNKRHLFFGLCRVFWREFFVMSTIIVLQAVSNFLSPIALNKIIAALESDGNNDYVRPWFWVLCLFLGRISMSLCWQGYVFVATMVVTRTQAILTELIFEHSLRIRFKAEKSDIVNSAKGKSSAAAPAAASGKKDNPIGKINTMVTVDVSTIVGGKDFLMVVIQGPLELVFAAIFLFKLLGWSALISFISILLFLPVPGYIASKMQKIHRSRMDKTDARVQSVTEILGVIRMVKMFGWENKISETLSAKREAELVFLWKEKVINLVNDVINFVIPTITMLLTYGTHTLVMKESLSASKVFSTMAVFEIVRGLLRRTSFLFGLSVKGKVSLDRVSKFLLETELLDNFSESDAASTTHIPAEVAAVGSIGFNNAEFAWSKEAGNGTAIASSRAFHLRIEGQMTFKRGAINLIVGPTGAGKTSILMALLGEMYFIPTGVDSWYSLPRDEGIAYAAQESWVQNDTIRNDILFGSSYNQERYQKVIYQCALTRDLELFDIGDDTEVGERGITLSGGQKARVTLARAIYSSANILLLDDVLAALDVHTSKWIVEKCLQGDLIRGRTVLLITHNVALASPIADQIVSVGLDGVAREIGKDIKVALANDSVLASEVQQVKEENEIENVVIDSSAKEESLNSREGKLIMAEEIAQGRVSKKSYMLFLRGLGADQPFLFLTTWMTSLALMHGGSMLAVWFLGYWGHQYETHDPKDVQVQYYLAIYSSILLISTVIYLMAMLTYNCGTQRASRKINDQLINSIFQSTFRWLDQTPASRIIARFSKDIAIIDDNLADSLCKVIDMVIAVVVKLGGPVLLTPIFFFPGFLITVLGVYLGNVYLRAQMSMKRESSNAQAPVLAHFGAAFAGLVSIRAYGSQESFKTEALKRIDHYTKVSKMSYDLNRWIGIRIDFLGASFTAALATYLLFNRSLNASNIGFSLTMALEFCGLILWLVRFYNFLEVESNSLERVQSYLDIEHEPAPTEAGKPPAAWPISGELQVDGLSARYSATGPNVLHNLTFDVQAGERIGIVGRTGSGKSSLTLSLLRLILTDGVVYYNGLPTNKINLDALRSSITIIPQVPELLRGTLRRNLDPFDQHSDSTLNDALRSAGLFALQIPTPDSGERYHDSHDLKNLTLDSYISSGGGNLSMGQRQIIALARAIVRRSKLLILDEATSAIDHKTDSIIQSSLRNELGSDVTVLTVAHRLQTIMDADKIMVLDEGKIMEFDTPQNLLKQQDGYFKFLVDSSGDRSALYTMAEKKADSE